MLLSGLMKLHNSYLLPEVLFHIFTNTLYNKRIGKLLQGSVYMVENLAIASHHEAGDRATAFITGAGSPISMALMKELSGTFRFVATASPRSVHKVGQFMIDNGVAGAVYGYDLGKTPATSPEGETTEPYEAVKWYDRAVAEHGEPDTVIYNAGTAAAKPLGELSAAEVVTAMNVNAVSALLLARESMGALAAARERDPRLSTFSYPTTLGATHPLTNQEVYAAGNSAMDGFVRGAVAQERSVEDPTSPEAHFRNGVPLTYDQYVRARGVRIGPVDGGGMFSREAGDAMQGMVHHVMEGRPFTVVEAARSIALVTFGVYGSMQEPIVRSTGGFVDRVPGKPFDDIKEPEIPREALARPFVFER